MSSNCFDELPPELILLLPQFLSIGSLSATVMTSRRLREILQPELESRLTPELGWELLPWATGTKPHIVAKLLSPPHSLNPSSYGLLHQNPLYIATKAGNLQIASLLLEAGANPVAERGYDEYHPLHLAAMNEDVEMMRLLLHHGAPTDTTGCDGWSENALNAACKSGHMEMIHLLLDHGASLENGGE
ncbi:ankyrin repeat-containing domain protein [Mycena rosella]|uniref:Ankyrin repeat-containing domain protein n=1 Tax=Mycena rosella TaxID=1033263 RepID=A0AAD7DS34_MYCRO|nr:ankyrin repeat-containing domain protein [Mycena rosella]